MERGIRWVGLCVLWCVVLQNRSAHAQELPGYQHFDIDTSIISDTAWVKDSTEIYYVESGTKDLYSIAANGSGKRKIVSGLRLRTFGWLPSGKELFCVTEQGLILVNVETGQQDVIARDVDVVQSVAWSSTGRLGVFGTNLANDERAYYLYDRETRRQKEILRTTPSSYPTNYVTALLWAKEEPGQLYAFVTRFTTGNDTVDQVLSYDVASGTFQVVREGYDREHGGTFSWSYIEALKDALIFPQMNCPVNTISYELKAEHGVRIVLSHSDIILERRAGSDGSSERYRLGITSNSLPWERPLPGARPWGFFWLPGNRYIIFMRGRAGDQYDICLLDPAEMKAGVLTQGQDFGWYNEHVRYDQWRRAPWPHGNVRDGKYYPVSNDF